MLKKLFCCSGDFSWTGFFDPLANQFIDVSISRSFDATDATTTTSSSATS